MWKNIKFTFGILMVLQINFTNSFDFESDNDDNEIDLTTTIEPDIENKTKEITSDNTTTIDNIEDTTIFDNDTIKYYEVTSIVNEDATITEPTPTTEILLKHTRTTDKDVITRATEETEKEIADYTDTSEQTETTELIETTTQTHKETARSWEPSDKKVNSFKKKIFEKTKKNFDGVNKKIKSTEKEEKPGKRLFTFLNKFVSPVRIGCAHYKKSRKEFNMDAMIDVWRTIYYQLTDKVFCFKIYIRKLNEEDKREVAKTYGNFSGGVDWSKCNLEIKSAEKLDRKHYLQGTNEDDGVFTNIIIMEDKYGSPYLKKETPDQWMVVKHLLLMRDCDTGGVLIFSRYPHHPGRYAMLEGLHKFGEKAQNGRMACEQNEVAGRSFGDEDSTGA